MDTHARSPQINTQTRKHNSTPAVRSAAGKDLYMKQISCVVFVCVFSHVCIIMLTEKVPKCVSMSLVK